jgi:hypothetical protein
VSFRGRLFFLLFLAGRRVDVTEFIAWAKACGADPQDAFARFLNSP